MDWLGVWGSFFPQSPLTLETVEGEQQRAIAKIGSLFRLIPGGPESMGRLPPLVTPDTIPDPVPIPGPVLEGSDGESPPLPVPVKEELEDELPGWARWRPRLTLIVISRLQAKRKKKQKAEISLEDLQSNIVAAINKRANNLEGMISRNKVGIEALKRSK
ncbi:hypothetical protein CRENBAI_024195 [Crenichthys baileyi]|uniref:Uncharacterized protein n=1 Tax=Crenichthys baileyi TaxID=28760 RepID=A0AAV9RPI3_9TELE